MSLKNTSEKSSEKTRNNNHILSLSWTEFLRQLEYVLNIINQMCIGFVTIYMTWLCVRNKFIGTSLHAWLVTIGFSFLMAEAVMCHYENNVLTFNFRRKAKTTFHWVLQVLGGGCGVAGVVVQLLKDKFPLFSLHGKLGFAAFVLCLFSMLSGLLALFSGSLRRWLSPLLNKTFHNLAGMGAFITALTAQFYGYDMHLITKNAPIDFRVMLKCLTLISLVLTCIGPFKALINKLSSLTVKLFTNKSPK